MTVASAPPGHVEIVRRFNRFYTRQIGALDEGFLDSPFSLTEVRLLYEIAHREETTATQLVQELGLDAGYVSRILREFRRRGLVRTRRSAADRRQAMLTLTRKGEREFARLSALQRRAIERLLSPLTAADRDRLVRALADVERVLAAPPARGAPYTLRPHRSGDMGWVVHRHGVLYTQEYGWDERFEALVARITADFIEQFDRKRERCWIAERDGEIVGSVFLVKHPERAGVARLRLLLVEPRARGLGIGRRLVHECTRFARRAGYHTITLWTNSVLHAARHLYEGEGYTIVHEETHHSFGRDLVGQTWELRL